MPFSSETSFDTRGFIFSLKCLLALVVAFAGVHYTTAYASDYFVQEGEEARLQAELSLLEIQARRTMRSIGEVTLLEELEKYEATLSTRTIGTASIDTLAKAHTHMIAADLTSMQLYLFENGYATATIPILSKGKRGSRWETPTGLYKIETKASNHFSSIGEVYMPYSMQFFGNFFIHGWPYYPNGNPVPEGFSGGCIRLSTDDAARVFTFAAPGTPIFIYETNDAQQASITVPDTLPKIGAYAFLVANVIDGTVYAEKNADAVVPIASLTKLVTALVANETIHYDRELSISHEDILSAQGTPGQLREGDTFTVANLVSALLMESNNTVAQTLARYNGLKIFIHWMNAKARAIGMAQTSFEDPSGISEKNTASATDIFHLLRYIRTSQSFILNVSREPSRTITSLSGRAYSLANFNHFSQDSEFLGGKTGYIEAARETMAAVFEVPVADKRIPIAIVVLGSDDRKSDVEALHAWFARSTKSPLP